MLHQAVSHLFYSGNPWPSPAFHDIGIFEKCRPTSCRMSCSWICVMFTHNQIRVVHLWQGSTLKGSRYLSWPCPVCSFPLTVLALMIKELSVQFLLCEVAVFAFLVNLLARYFELCNYLITSQIFTHWLQYLIFASVVMVLVKMVIS